MKENILHNAVREVREGVFYKPYENMDVLVERARDGSS